MFSGSIYFWGSKYSFPPRCMPCLLFLLICFKGITLEPFFKKTILSMSQRFFWMVIGRFLYSVSRPVDMKNHLHTNRCNDRWACANNFEGPLGFESHTNLKHWSVLFIHFTNLLMMISTTWVEKKNCSSRQSIQSLVGMCGIVDPACGHVWLGVQG